MSNVLKNKMYDYEVSPPKTAWENIVLSLDELAIHKKLSNKLYNQEAEPPSTAWGKITNALDQTSHSTKFRDEVLKLEVLPPTSAWDKISIQLDEAPQEGFSKKIYEYEVAPPLSTWQKIISVLDAEQKTTPVIPLQKTYNRIIRIAAAAAIIGFIAWAGFGLLKKDENSANTNNVLANKDGKTIVPAIPAIKPNQDSPSEKIKEKPATAEHNNVIALVSPAKINSKKIVKTTAENKTELFNVLASAEDHSASNDIAVEDIQSLHEKNKAVTGFAENASEARYLVYLTDQGAMVKLSKKLVDMKCIYSKDGDINQDALAKLDASECNDRVKYWQEKVANSSLQISSNPLELIEILK